jgi:hypothetical protein
MAEFGAGANSDMVPVAWRAVRYQNGFGHSETPEHTRLDRPSTPANFSD